FFRLEVCSYSGYKVYPGHGKRAIRGDGRQFYFLSSKCERSHYLKRNPREVSWTVLYRRKYRKGAVEELAKKRTKKVTKTARAFAGASLTEIMAKRNQNPEVRKAMREQAMRALKEKQKAKEAEKRAKKAELKKKQTAGPAQKQQQKAAKKVGKPTQKGGKRF
uniref:Large ribosomal subunit protein eL24 n=1 Tax=Mesocestoides corti TaxID=53468 RepID=A0A5K3EJ96_MESCO